MNSKCNLAGWRESKWLPPTDVRDYIESDNPP